MTLAVFVREAQLSLRYCTEGYEEEELQNEAMTDRQRWRDTNTETEE